jgi:hypothetical protein
MAKEKKKMRETNLKQNEESGWEYRIKGGNL